MRRYVIASNKPTPTVIYFYFFLMSELMYYRKVLRSNDKALFNTDGDVFFCFFCRWRKGKMLLLASLSCWIIFTLPLGFIQPPATRCIVKKNASTYMLETPMAPKVYKRDVSSVTDFVKYDQEINDFEVPDLSTPVIRRTRRGVRPRFTAGRSPLDVKFASNYNEKQHYNLVMPIYSHIVYTIEVSRRAER